MTKPGQSLIELIIAIGAIGSILVAIVATATRSLAIQTFSRTQAQATKLAQEQIERVRAFRDQNGLSSLSCASLCSITSNSSPLTIDTSTTLSGELEVWFEIAEPGTCPTPPPGVTEMKEVAALAQWQDAKGSHRSTIVTCLSDDASWVQ